LEFSAEARFFWPRSTRGRYRIGIVRDRQQRRVLPGRPCPASILPSFLSSLPRLLRLLRLSPFSNPSNPSLIHCVRPAAGWLIVAGLNCLGWISPAGARSDYWQIGTIIIRCGRLREGCQTRWSSRASLSFQAQRRRDCGAGVKDDGLIPPSQQPYMRLLRECVAVL